MPGRANVDFVSFYRKRDADGHVKAHWTTSTDVYFPEHRGTPGASERGSAPTVAVTTLARSPFIFNEVGNNSTDDYDWIELRNVATTTQNLKNRRISIITSNSSDVELVTFPNKDINVAAGGVFLVVKTDPSGDEDHPLAAGYNIDKNDANQIVGVPKDHPARYIVLSGLVLPDGNFVLALRGNNKDHLGKPDGVIDVAGYDIDLALDSASIFTSLWPLRNFGAPVALNNFVNNTVHRRQHAGIDGTKTTNKADNADHIAFRDIGWQGVGYKRNADADAANGGTPGYNNDVVKSEGADATGAVVISEVMSDTTGRRPQWIELFNTSRTVGVNIDNWSIFVVNHGLLPDGTNYENTKGFSERIDLDGKIPPRQTFLIVSTGGSDGTNLPSERIHNLRRGRGAQLLNPNGFYLTLKAKTNEGDAAKHQTVDTVGNLADPATLNSRRADAQSFEDLAWALPSGITEVGDRVSVARRTGPNVTALGTEAGAWISSDMGSTPRYVARESLLWASNRYLLTGYDYRWSLAGITVEVPSGTSQRHWRNRRPLDH